MSTLRSELKGALKNLNVGQPFHIPAKIEFKMPADVAKQPHDKNSNSPAPSVSTVSLSSNLGESLSGFDSVQNGQCPDLTVCGPKIEMSTENKTTVSKLNTVKTEQCLNLTVSKLDTVAIPHTQAGFTKVPNSVLRLAGSFEDPLDFMIYLYLFSFSHGFHRDWARAAQSQLEQFTGAAKNTVKRSIARLEAQGWIKLRDQYEHSRASKTWVVTAPEKMLLTVSNLDPFKVTAYPAFTQEIGSEL